MLDAVQELDGLGPDRVAVDQISPAVGADRPLRAIADMGQGAERSGRFHRSLLSQDDADDPSHRSRRPVLDSRSPGPLMPVLPPLFKKRRCDLSSCSIK